MDEPIESDMFLYPDDAISYQDSIEVKIENGKMNKTTIREYILENGKPPVTKIYRKERDSYV